MKKRRNWVNWAQVLCVVIAVGLVASFFVGGLFTGGTPADEPVEPQEPTTQAGEPVDEGDPQPGVPAVPVAEHEVWELEEEVNPDRQLDYQPEGEPDVEFQDAPGEDLAGYWTQSIDWQPCHDGDLCATVLTPLDWEDPGTAAIQLKVRRSPVEDPTQDPMFLNPGGPGIGGQYMVDSVGDRWPSYDKIAWDPRGTGESTAVQCGTTEEIDEAYELDGSPDDAAEEEALEAGWGEFAQDCRDASGALLDHLSTIEVVRDLDLLRHLVGAEKLNYLGVSYGTYLGAMYAELFPERTGRMVLDSAVNITDDEGAPNQIEGFELALRNYAEWCAGEDRCVFGESRDEVMATIGDWLSGLDANPITVGERELTQTLATVGVLLFLYSDEEAYEGLTYVVMEAMEGRAEELLKAADSLNMRGDPAIGAFPAMRCADWPDEGVDAAYEWFEEVKPLAPTLAPNSGMDLVCETWTADSAPPLKLTGQGAAPLLVIGTTGDSATPYEHAVAMAEQLDSGVLVTLDGAGHGSATGDNECLQDVLTAFYEDGTVPDEGVTCS
ncbi:alpha/beta fold hydrolase [Tessaracoccus rhinocerotis]|uniref:Alpha/beta fold hydrolase n=1 Tax=Tessaracoccus rhinocerotis TaxID=1689449 RepID=A0A553K1G7_9ACTN|nr:alpha/beta hydrolase [Tessaracoccus rhinocerotis]TRY18544.1 alpha/beta fold hydrolase [Tessaracoccus rhinocerotis]